MPQNKDQDLYKLHSSAFENQESWSMPDMGRWLSPVSGKMYRTLVRKLLQWLVGYVGRRSEDTAIIVWSVCVNDRRSANQRSQACRLDRLSHRTDGPVGNFRLVVESLGQCGSQQVSSYQQHNAVADSCTAETSLFLSCTLRGPYIINICLS